ncbi:MAG TPA: Vms1/Ankzf1 family peptidyl-tRNA hydrolase [Candidatus Limnocylindria bacterium]|nr:Vms1/Ankzf1 family peptidyl-tRNA hydrolase [Candidatus Limnocylindria bacterium]
MAAIDTEQAHRARPGRARAAHERAARLLRSLSERESTRFPFLTVYLDVRPPADAQEPRSRAARVILTGALRSFDALLPAHGPERNSFTDDVRRIEELVASAEAADGERGIAAFACGAEGLFESLRTWSPWEQRVEVGAVPVLGPLARFVSHEPAIVALADTNSLRLFAVQPGRLEELPSIDDEPDDYRRTEAGGWSQARYQRHVDDHRAGFARRAVAVIDRAVRAEQARRVILAGDEVAIPRLRDELATDVGELVRDVLRLELRASHDEIEAKALPAIERAEAADGRQAADRLTDAVRGNGLGAGGREATRLALEMGEGMELLLDGSVVAEADVEDLIRLAARTDARITFVSDHEGLQSMEGVGALLRFRA